MTHDQARGSRGLSTGGLGFAALAAGSFGLSGSLAGGLMASGWSPGAAVTVRVVVGAVVLLGPALVALRGRWALLRGNVGLLAAFGVIAVAGCQLAYFNAVQHMAVGLALLVEYTAPVAVVGWLWLRHGQRPGRKTVAGALLAALGLLLVLDLFSGPKVSGVGLAWAMAAMVGVAFFFVVSATEDNGVPPLVLACGGLVVGSLVLVPAGALGLVPWHASSSPVIYGGARVPAWLPLLGLGAVSAAVAYVAGIAASRRLGSRLASFVGLLEVLFALVSAWLLLGQLPTAVQLLGAALVLSGVVAVKLGEAQTSRSGLAPSSPIVLPPDEHLSGQQHQRGSRGDGQ